MSPCSTRSPACGPLTLEAVGQDDTETASSAVHRPTCTVIIFLNQERCARGQLRLHAAPLVHAAARTIDVSDPDCQSGDTIQDRAEYALESLLRTSAQRFRPRNPQAMEDQLHYTARRKEGEGPSATPEASASHPEQCLLSGLDSRLASGIFMPQAMQ